MNKYLRELALLRCGESLDKQGRLSKSMQEMLLNFFAKAKYYNCTTCVKRFNCPNDADPFSINKACNNYVFDQFLLRG